MEHEQTSTRYVCRDLNSFLGRMACVCWWKIVDVEDCDDHVAHQLSCMNSWAEPAESKEGSGDFSTRLQLLDVWQHVWASTNGGSASQDESTTDINALGQFLDTFECSGCVCACASLRDCLITTTWIGFRLLQELQLSIWRLTRSCWTCILKLGDFFLISVSETTCQWAIVSLFPGFAMAWDWGSSGVDNNEMVAPLGNHFQLCWVQMQLLQARCIKSTCELASRLQLWVF